MSYSYKRIADIKQPADKVNVWAVVTFISFTGNELKMMLVDENEAQIFCVLGVDGKKNFGTIPLSNSMIIRIHRAKVCRAINNQITIVGRINCAGLHVAAWCVDDLDNSVRYRSSELLTFEQADAQRLQQLRTFWKRRNVDDGMARQLFFEMVKLRQPWPVPASEHRPMTSEVAIGTVSFGPTRRSSVSRSDSQTSFDHFADKATTSSSNRCSPSIEVMDPSDGNDNETSFDHFANEATSSIRSAMTEIVDNGINRSDDGRRRLANRRTAAAVPKSEPLTLLDGTFLDKLRATVRNIAQQLPSLHKWTSFSGLRMNAYFDIICQIVAVHVPLQGFETQLPTYLRVCDGTQLEIETGNLYSVSSIRDTHAVQSQLFADEAIPHQFDFVYMIGCWEAFAEKAKQFEAGDIIKILNAKFASRPNGGIVHISLHGHTPNSQLRYVRDIECVRKAKRHLEEEGNGAVRTETERNGGRSADRKRGHDSARRAEDSRWRGMDVKRGGQGFLGAFC